MMFILLGICLALAAFFALNAIASLLTSALWLLSRRSLKELRANARARLLFALRVFPPIGSAIFMAALILPAYIIHEPRDSAEPVGFKLAMLAAISAIGLSLALWRAAAGWLATRRLIHNWIANAEPLRLDGVSIPAYRLRHQFPVIALVGVFRPRLFVADHLVQLLDREEIAAAVAHERAHLAAKDNFKRALLRACRDVLFIAPFGRDLDRAWAEASEAAADERAATESGFTLSLASALVKIARLVPNGIKPTLPAGALLIGDGSSGIANRVERLTLMAGINPPAPKERSFTSAALSWMRIIAVLIGAVLMATNPSLLLVTHKMIEIVVAKLQ